MIVMARALQPDVGSARPFDHTRTTDTKDAMHEPCDICLAADSMLEDLQVSMLGMFDARVWRCSKCGFRQIRPRLDVSELRALYPGDYFDLDSPVGYSDYAREQQRCERDAYFLARSLRRLAPTGELLDVGCALGFLIEALERYCGWSTRGIDVSPFAAYFARRQFGLDVRAVTLEEAAFPDARFDFIVQKDVLEHVLHPREHLRETARILKPGGRMWLVTPNGEANLSPLRRSAHDLAARGEPLLPMLDQGHLQFFSRGNLLRLFEDCGFRVVGMRSISVQRGLRALGVLPRKRRKLKTAPAGRPRPGASRDVATHPSAHDAERAIAAGVSIGGGSRSASAVIAPPAGTGEPRPAAPPADSAADARTIALYERLSMAVARHRSAVRGTPLYFRFRHAMTEWDTLPARLELGNDFSCVVEKR